MTEYDVGDTWIDEEEGLAWQVQSIVYSYEVQVRPVDGDGDESDVDTVTYPADSLARKIDWEGLVPVEDDTDDEDTGETYLCKFCDETFDTEQGLRTHVGMLHDVTADDE